MPKGGELQQHRQVAAAEGDDGGEEIAVLVALGKGVDVGSVVAVLVEPDDDAVVAELLLDFAFEGGGDGAELGHRECRFAMWG